LFELSIRNVRTTFFYVGMKIDITNRHIIKKAHEAGHDIGIHSWSDVDFCTLSEEQITLELKKTSDLIYSIIGVRPRLFRPLHGIIDARVQKIIKKLGYISVTWNVELFEIIRPKKVDTCFSSFTKNIEKSVISSTSFICHQHEFVDITIEMIAKIHTYLNWKGLKHAKVSDCLGVAPYY